MSDYELFILFGTFLLIIGLIKFFTSVTSRRSVGAGLLIFAVGGGMLVYVNTMTPSGLKPGDVPDALYKLIGIIF